MTHPDPFQIPPVREVAVTISDEFLAMLAQEDPWTDEQYELVETGAIS